MHRRPIRRESNGSRGGRIFLEGASAKLFFCFKNDRENHSYQDVREDTRVPLGISFILEVREVALNFETLTQQSREMLTRNGVWPGAQSVVSFRFLPGY